MSKTNAAGLPTVVIALPRAILQFSHDHAISQTSSAQNQIRTTNASSANWWMVSDGMEMHCRRTAADTHLV